MPAPTPPQPLRGFETLAHKITKKDVSRLHRALKRLGFEIGPDEIARGLLGPTTRAALRKLQTDANLDETGEITPQTIKVIEKALEHAFFAHHKPRTQRLQRLLLRLGHKLDDADLKTRRFGKSTENAVKRFQKAAKLPVDGRVTEALFNRI